jgi:hypothetical protein
MTYIVPFGFGNETAKNRPTINKPKNIISALVLIDLIVILPSSIVFLLIDLNNIRALTPFFRVFVPLIILSVPIAVLIFGFFLVKRVDLSKSEREKENVVPVLMFLLFVFSMFGIYIPAITKLVSLVPSLYGFEVVGFCTIFFYLVYVIKSVTSIL